MGNGTAAKKQDRTSFFDFPPPVSSLPSPGQRESSRETYEAEQIREVAVFEYHARRQVVHARLAQVFHSRADGNRAVHVVARPDIVLRPFQMALLTGKTARIVAREIE